MMEKAAATPETKTIHTHAAVQISTQVVDSRSVVDAEPKEADKKEEAEKEAKTPETKTIHQHAVAAEKSAGEADASLKEAQKALEKTKGNVKQIEESGKKIEGVAADIDKLYTPEKKEEKKSSAFS